MRHRFEVPMYLKTLSRNMRKCIIVYIFSTRMLVMHVEIAELIGGIRWSQAGGMRMCFSSMIIVQLSGKDSMKPSWGVGVCFFLQDRPIDRGIRWSRADEAGKKQIINQTSPHILYKCINLASHNNFIVCWLSRPTHHFVRSTCWNNTHCLATWPWTRTAVWNARPYQSSIWI